MKFSPKYFPFTLVGVSLLIVLYSREYWGNLIPPYDDGGMAIIPYALIAAISLPFEIGPHWSIGLLLFISLDLVLAWFRNARTKGIFNTTKKPANHPIKRTE